MRTAPIGVDVQQPRFSWQIVSAIRGSKPTAYQIMVAESPGKLRQEKRPGLEQRKSGKQQFHPDPLCWSTTLFPGNLLLEGKGLDQMMVVTLPANRVPGVWPSCPPATGKHPGLGLTA